MPTRRLLVLFSTVLGVALALWGSFSALQCARAVEVLTTFAGAFGAGAGVTALVMERRSGRA